MSENAERMTRKTGKPGCVVPAALLDYHRKKLSRPARKEVRRHLRRCPVCRRDSRFVAIIVGDENRLIRGLEALLPARRETAMSTAGAALRRGEFRPSLSIAAAAAAAGVLLAFFVFQPEHRFPEDSPGRPDSPAVINGSAERAAQAEHAFIPRLERLLTRPRDIRERLVHSGILNGPDFGPPPVAIPDAGLALSSFKISSNRDREEELFGWSLAYRPEIESPYSVLSPR